MTDSSRRRADGRMPDELRPIRIEANVLSQPNGSASVAFGSTRVLAAVYGPKPLDKRLGFSKKGIISCDIKTTNYLNKDTARVVKNVLETVVDLNAFPNSCLEIQAVVLESNGSELGVLITAVNIAVAQSGVDMFDLVGFDGLFYWDPSNEECKEAEFEMIIAAHPSTNAACYFSMGGTVVDALVPEALERCMECCSMIRNEVRKALI